MVPPADGADQLAIYAEFRDQCLLASRDPLDLVNEKIAAAEKAGRSLSPTMVDAMVRNAMSAGGRAEKRSEPTDAEIVARVNSLAGSQFVVWLRLVKADPTLTRAWVAEHVPDMATRHAVFARLTKIDGLASLDPKKV